MSERYMPITSRIGTVITIALAVIATNVSIAQDNDGPPKRTVEGLELVKQTKRRLVYVAPDADFSRYTDVSILDCYVAFKKDWQQDYNRNSGRSLQQRVDDNDMDRMKKRLADEFKEIFIDELTKEGKHEVVDHVGPEVLVLRPAIVNLDVTSPDMSMSQSSRSRSYNTNAGQMTLYLELYDSVTSTIIAKVMDAQADRGTGGFAMAASRVSNTAAADRILRGWARELAGHLGEVKSDGEDAE